MFLAECNRLLSVFAVSFAAFSIACEPVRALADVPVADSTPLIAVSDPQLAGITGTWEGTWAMGEEAHPTRFDVSMELGGHWLVMKVTTWSDSTRKDVSFEAIVYFRPEKTPGSYRAYYVDGMGSGQIGTATVENGVWKWRWEWDDGEVEVGTMVTSQPGRITYESRITDSAGQPVSFIQFDISKREATASKTH